MKWVVAVGLLVGIGLTLSPASAQPYHPGERITFAIKKLGLKAGEAALEFRGEVEREGRTLHLIVFTARAMNFFDEEKIYVSPETYRPVRVERDLNIWGKKERIAEEYDQTRGEIRIIKDAGGKVTEQVLRKGHPVDNIYGFIYRLRRGGNWNDLDRVDMSLPTKDVVFLKEKQDDIKAGGRRYEALVLASEPAEYRVWFDLSDQRIPLRIDGAVGFGNTAMIMRSYEPGGE